MRRQSVAERHHEENIRLLSRKATINTMQTGLGKIKEGFLDCHIILRNFCRLFRKFVRYIWSLYLELFSEMNVSGLEYKTFASTLDRFPGMRKKFLFQPIS